MRSALVFVVKPGLMVFSQARSFVCEVAVSIQSLVLAEFLLYALPGDVMDAQMYIAPLIMRTTPRACRWPLGVRK